MVLAMFSFLKKSVLADGPADAYGFSFASIDGGILDLSDFKGKAVLIVNTASRCGFTKQYEGLQKLYDTYKDRGLVVMGVPSNDFGEQEPGTAEEIKKFCSSVYKITFPLTEKTIVSGHDDAHPFYKWAAAQRKGGMIFSKPRWNFHKYLLKTDGTLAASFGSQVTPDDHDLVTAVEAALPQ